MPRRPGGGPRGYDKFQERLTRTQANQEREEQRRERERNEAREAQRLFEQQQALRDEEMRLSMLDMSAAQREQVRINDDGFLRHWGIKDHRQTVVPSADDRLDKIREDAERRESERQLDLQRQLTEDLARREAIRVAAQQLYEETMESLRQTQARVAIDRWDSTRGNDYR